MPAGTLMVGRCWSTAKVSARFAQSLVPFTSAGISPVQVTLTVWPTLEGTVMLLVGGLDASAVRTKDERVIVAMIAATITKATATRMIFIRKPSDLVQRFSRSCDMRCLL